MLLIGFEYNGSKGHFEEFYNPLKNGAILCFVSLQLTEEYNGFC